MVNKGKEGEEYGGMKKLSLIFYRGEEERGNKRNKKKQSQSEE